MANTWRGMGISFLQPSQEAHIMQGPAPSICYVIRRSGPGLVYSVKIPASPEIDLPVSIVMGGRRHGLGFLARIAEIQGVTLARPALIQARYFRSFTHEDLVLAPGVSAGNAHSYDSALGVVLSPSFEKKCLDCHGQPDTLGASSQGGVHCESCHGPGRQHLQALGSHATNLGMSSLKNLTAEQSIAVCARCHSGFGPRSDPDPEELLIANQTTALMRSECFIQSSKKFACIACHNPHRDSANSSAVVSTCLGCHSTSAKPHAGICPVNQTTDCIQCHMPSVEIGPLHLVDHLIRIHPEQNIKAPKYDTSFRSEIPPQREFLEMIAMDSQTAADEATARLARGDGFFDVARDLSRDSAAPIGGFLGERVLSQFETELAVVAAKLNYGETSAVFRSGNRWIVFRRLPRDFRWQVGQLIEAATAAMKNGDFKAAVAHCQQALAVYPYSLRALTFMGVAMRESGRLHQAADIFQASAQLYPKDAEAHLQLGLTYRLLNDHAKEIEAYQNAIQLDPDIVSAYVNLGFALYGTGDSAGSIATFRKGLQIDPLSVELYYNLGLALERQGDAEEARQNLHLAAILDPETATITSK